MNVGHSFELQAPAGSSVTADGEVLPLRQLHFHLPSEHVRHGRHWAMEVHFVHQSPDKNGPTAVVAVMLEAGAPNPVFHRIMAAAPQQAGRHREVAIDPRALLPATRSHYRCEGSPTTPPCCGTVDWEVIDRPVTVAAADIARFRPLIGPNARPVQPAGRRLILHVPG